MRTSPLDDETYREPDRHALVPEIIPGPKVTIGQPDAPTPRPASALTAAPRRFGDAILKRVLGPKKPSPATIDEKIAAIHAEIAAAEAQQREASAKLARPGLLSDDEHQRAEADMGAARRAIVRHKDVIQVLEAEREVLAAVEARAAFLSDVAAARARAARAKQRLQAEYASAARIIASVLKDVGVSQAEIESLRVRSLEFGETVEIEHPAAFCTHSANLLTDVSLPGLMSDEPEFVTPDRAELARRWAVLA